MPAVLNEKIRRMMRGHEPPYIRLIEIGPWGNRAPAKMVIILDNNMDKRSFITNIDLDRKRTRMLSHLYSKRGELRQVIG